MRAVAYLRCLSGIADISTVGAYDGLDQCGKAGRAANWKEAKDRAIAQLQAWGYRPFSNAEELTWKHVSDSEICADVERSASKR